MSKQISIRMYDMGFGDCFLLSFPLSEKKTLKVLIDCGSVAEGENTVESVVQSIKEWASQNEFDDKPRLDLVIVSHRHKDHLHGFRLSEYWSEFEVKEIWMPWTEQKDDPRAQHLRLQQRQFAEAVQLASLAPSLTLVQQGILNMAAELALANDEAMETLWNGFANGPRRVYLEATEGIYSQTVLPGVTVRVLGPTRDEKKMRIQDSADESYLTRLAALADTSQGIETKSPFTRCVTTFAADKLVPEFPYLHLPDKTLKFLENTLKESGVGFAKLLDSMINNSSLVLIFQIGTAKLLFPGDAQWGSWQQILENPEQRKQLKDLTFYKVSHHASHNGTPKTLVETVLNPNVTAAASTKHTNKWKSIPRDPLLKAMAKQTGKKVARTDKLNKASLPPGCTVGNDKPKFIEIVVPC